MNGLSVGSRVGIKGDAPADETLSDAPKVPRIPYGKSGAS